MKVSSQVSSNPKDRTPPMTREDFIASMHSNSSKDPNSLANSRRIRPFDSNSNKGQIGAETQNANLMNLLTDQLNRMEISEIQEKLDADPL